MRNFFCRASLLVILFSFGFFFLRTDVHATGDLKSWWKLDEASGNAYDSSKNTLELVNTNVTYTTGRIDGAAEFNGSDAYLSQLGPALANRSFTISSWLYANNLSADQVWLNVGSNSVTDEALHLRLTTTGALRFGFYFDDLETAGGVFTAGSWHQVVYTYNATTNQRVIYIDGVQRGSDVATGDFAGNNEIYLGSWGNDEVWNGNIDDVKIYTRVLTSSEIADLAGGGTGPIPVQSVADVTWSEVQPAGDTDLYWTSAKISRDGNVILMGAQNGEGLYLSKDRGITWSTVEPLGLTDETWFATGVSADGRVIMAATYGGRVLVSTDGGDTWEDKLAAGDVNSNWVAGSISADGQTMIVGVSTGRLYVSTDGGSTWSETQPAGNTDKAWHKAAVSSDGGVILAGVYGGRLYRSTDQGDSWAEVQPAGNVDANWNGISLDKQGETMLVVIDSSSSGIGKAYISRDGGDTWSNNTPEEINQQQWRVSSMSEDGQKMLLSFADGTYGRLWFSQNSGQSWVEARPAGDTEKFWNAGVISGDGYTYVAAVGSSSGTRRVYIVRLTRPVQQTQSQSASTQPQSARPWVCATSAPSSIPDLFQIDAATDKAKLYFSPVMNDTDRYYISFGLKPGDMQFGTEVVSNASGVMSYTIDHLSPRSTYYIRVRAGNGCATGEWSNEMKFMTASKGSTSGRSFYKNFPSRVVSAIERIVKF
jgi:photosystem II stability/assembly factor-like uncharacterized protein